jgi:hypothetical protein
MECQSYKSLSRDYLVALREWAQVVVQEYSLSLYPTKLRRQAVAQRDKALELASAHQRQCLLCANLEPVEENFKIRSQSS